GQQGNKGQAAKMVDDKRPGDNLRRQGNDEEFVEQGHRQADLLGFEQTLEQTKYAPLQRWDQQDQAESSHKAELKADIPENERSKQGQDKAGEDERVESQPWTPTPDRQYPD